MFFTCHLYLTETGNVTDISCNSRAHGLHEIHRQIYLVHLIQADTSFLVCARSYTHGASPHRRDFVTDIRQDLIAKKSDKKDITSNQDLAVLVTGVFRVTIQFLVIVI